ncbi:MAE_28990/MAE_18760 family HEPN-like nuclease [Kitasatospora xanthocidica]|uniref:MAE_28990/MAE_18760 family HEPN-like nuclease n=1 Tax=Kitasatospora xanthocidica TaxID=83382 RepID=UPI0015F31D0F
MALRSKLGRGEASKNSIAHTEIIETLRASDSLPASLPYTSAMIRTRSSLKSDVFADIMHSIGCDSSRHLIYRSTIDNRLLRHRNDIAHGREEYVSLSDWVDIRDRTVSIFKDVRTQISNAAVNEEYKAQLPGCLSRPAGESSSNTKIVSQLGEKEIPLRARERIEIMRARRPQDRPDPELLRCSQLKASADDAPRHPRLKAELRHHGVHAQVAT